MLDPFTLEEAVRLEHQIAAARASRRAFLLEQLPRSGAGFRMSSVRRHLARLLLALADWLDPRAVVRVPHVPARPTLNGTLHHA